MHEKIGSHVSHKLDSNLDIYLNIIKEELSSQYNIYPEDQLATYDRYISPHYRFDTPLHYLSTKYGLLSEYEKILGELCSGKEIKILDCGCGVGSQSILFGLLGAEVTGVDLFRDRLELAKSRKVFFEGKTGKKIKVEFMLKNIFKVLNSDYCFDIIYSRESISHIHPLESFIEMVRRKTSKDMKIFINDSNWGNPIVRYKVYKLFWNKNRNLKFFIKNYEDPDTGELIEVAKERMFSPRTISRLLNDYGFEVVDSKTIGFLPKLKICSILPVKMKQPAYRVLCNIDNILSKFILTRNHGTRMLLIAIPS